MLRGLALWACLASSCSLAGQSNGSRGSLNSPPTWPDIPLRSCPALAPHRELSQRTWKHGDTERDSFAAALQKLQAKDYAPAAVGFSSFASRYPDSEYEELALAFEMQAYTNLKEQDGIVAAAQKLALLPEAEPALREISFVDLAGGLSTYVRPDDPNEEKKLADLETWTRCGTEALAARLSATPGAPPANLDYTRKISQSVLDRTAGYVAYMRHDYVQADTKLTAARKLNPDDPLICLWLSKNKWFLPVPDANSAIFYLARWAVLVPKDYWAAPDAGDYSARSFKQIYVIVHGSNKGLSDVMRLAESNTEPPTGFNILPSVKEKHYGSTIAAMAVVALFTYGLAAHPELMGEIGRAVAGSLTEPQEMKLMLFGGPGHKVYLGCLSCPQTVMDSVFNRVGRYGSEISSESIWNPIGQYGSQVSPFSACNLAATDPPVIVDQAGQAYGRLTVNRASPQIGAGARFYDWVASAVCQSRLR